jgi:deoxyadenosine/deoxycytidine kinase
MNNIISIEGNIGSGKTTLFNLLRSSPVLHNVFFIEEPVDLWNKIFDDITGESILQRFYADPDRYAFAFQTMAFFSRLALLAEAPTGCTVVTERSLLTDRDVFAKMLHDNGNIDSLCYKIYLHNSASFSDVAPSKIIYIKTDPVVCEDRISIRNRNGESKISIDYLIKCEEYHEAMIRNAQSEILVLDGNQDGALRIMLHDALTSIENFILQQ